MQDEQKNCTIATLHQLWPSNISPLFLCANTLLKHNQKTHQRNMNPAKYNPAAITNAVGALAYTKAAVLGCMQKK